MWQHVSHILWHYIAINMYRKTLRMEQHVFFHFLYKNAFNYRRYMTNVCGHTGTPFGKPDTRRVEAAIAAD